MKIIHLLSGGLDSTALLYDLVAQGNMVHCLLFDYHQRHKQELLFAKEHAAKCGCNYTVMDLPDLGGLTEKSWIVPNRNAVFLSVAVNVACQLGFDHVSIGCNSGDAAYFPDCCQSFIKAMNEATNQAGYSVKIIAPYIDKPKAWIGGLAQEMGIKPHSIWTCYRPQNGVQCGTCPACLKLKDSFA